jgi:aspartate kinase
MKGIVPVITGFIAKDRAGSVTTLGRSGSDLTASVIGNAIMANEVQLWKDVNGILTADPRLASDAKSISHLSFFEASELARYGAKVLHPASVLPAMSKKIPVRIKNYQYPDHPGTLIKSHQPQRDGMVVAIAHKSHQSLIRITSHQGVGQFEFFTSVPQVFSELKLPAEITAATYNSILLMIGEHHCSSSLQKSLQHIGTVTIEHSKSNVSLIGTNERSSKFIETVIHALNSEGIEAQMISYGVSNVNTSLIVNDDEVKRCVEIIHRYFF